MSSKWREDVRHAFALRLGLWYAALFTASAITLAAFTYALLARALEAEDHDVLESMLSRYTAEYERGGLDGLQRLIDVDAAEGRHERLLIRVVRGPREIVYFAAPPGWGVFDLTPLDRPPASRSGWVTIESPPDRAIMEVGTSNLADDVTIQVGRTSHIRDELLGHFRARALEIVLLIALVAAAGGGLLTYLGLAPVRTLDATLRSILRTGRFDARVETRGSTDPLDALGGLVNEMLARIQTLLGGMRGALDNVAHDLRTPLTRFRNVAEAALVAGDQTATRDGLARAVEEADRVNATLTALMDISEAERGTMTLAPKRLRLAEVAREAVSLYADEAEDRGIVIHSNIDEAVELVADRTRLRQVFANLIENAVKYTDRGGRIDIETRASDNLVTTTVRDTGIGISAVDLPFVWDRLYRADASRSARGLGLGLSLGKAMVEAHGGRVAVSSSPGAGSAFSVTLPVPGTA
ncbi:MAG: HAMP domain-containing histidine kinase [Acidobacteria bacterium]|nr:HAMP domain-containing histidine kinase [Acidobacteriota bacterium]